MRKSWLVLLLFAMSGCVHNRVSTGDIYGVVGSVVRVPIVNNTTECLDLRFSDGQKPVRCLGPGQLMTVESVRIMADRLNVDVTARTTKGEVLGSTSRSYRYPRDHGVLVYDTWDISNIRELREVRPRGR